MEHIKQIKVSIIVPVYNIESYLSDCLNSIANQNHDNIELILVNDGSTDMSGNICDTYAMNSDKIMVIHKNNEGVSAARNIGMHHATGKYIQFVDGDDYIDPDYTNRMLEISEKYKADLVICGYNSLSLEKKKICKYLPDEVYSREEFIDQLYQFHANLLFNPLWNKIFCRETIEKYTVRFDENINLGEDLLFNLEYIKHTGRIVNLPDKLYNYRNRIPGSLTAISNINNYNIQLKLYESTYHVINEFGLNRTSNNAFFYNLYYYKEMRLIPECWEN